MLKVEELSGAQKAAVLLVQLGKEKSAMVLKSLRESEVEEVLNEIARLKGVPTETVDAVFEEFSSLAHARRYYAEGGMDFAREVLEASERLALESAVTPEDARRLAVQSEVTELVERQPDEVAQLLRGWLADRRS